MKKIIYFLVCLSFLACSKDNDDDNGKDDGGEDSSKVELQKAVYCINYAIKVSTSYNDNKQSPSSISAGDGQIASVYYLPNGSLNYIKFAQRNPLTSSVIAPFHIDVGKRPSTICAVSTLENAVYRSTIVNGTYDYDNDPANLIASFEAYVGSAKMTFAQLKIMANNDDITQEAYNAIHFPTNCYKIIVFGKNKAGKLIGKYVGYSLGTSYVYWDINPESSSFGKSGTTIF